jgi:predicted aspartyl protease
MPSFSYIEIGDKPAIPATIIYFVNFEEPELTAANDCGILDTGSDVTVVSMSLVSSIKARSIKTEPSTFKLLEEVVAGVPFFLKLSFDNSTFIKTKVFAVPDRILNGEAIIGRNVLNRHVITFDGLNKIFTIT